MVPQLIPLEIRATFQNEQDQPLKGLRPDPDLGYKYAPGLNKHPVPFTGDTGAMTYTVSTISLGYDEVGFRDDGLDDEPFGVVIGDSYVSCASVEITECWVELLEKEMGKDLVNLGVVGYSPQQEQRMLTKYGLPLQPELVMWVFFANDLDDAWRFDQFGSGPVQGKFWDKPVQGWLARNSTIYTTFSFFWHNRYLFYNLIRANREIVSGDSHLIWWLTYTDLAIPEVSEGLKLTQDAILTAYEQTQTRFPDTKFVVVIIPFREQVYAPSTLQDRFDDLNEALIDFCGQHNIPIIDLTPAIRAKASHETDPVYFTQDIHLNIQGNQLVAELLAQSLSRD